MPSVTVAFMSPPAAQIEDDGNSVPAFLAAFAFHPGEAVRNPADLFEDHRMGSVQPQVVHLLRFGGRGKPETLTQLGDLGRQVKKVDRWIERCSDDVQRRLSAGAKRDLDRRFHILAEHVDSALAETDDAKKWSLWASGVWAGLTFLEDARNTCPAYFRGLHWHNLLKTLTTLCNALEKVDPQIAEIGTRVYERAA